jgi:hypothetical protein
MRPTADLLFIAEQNGHDFPTLRCDIEARLRSICGVLHPELIPELADELCEMQRRFAYEVRRVNAPTEDLGASVAVWHRDIKFA